MSHMRISSPENGQTTWLGFIPTCDFNDRDWTETAIFVTRNGCFFFFLLLWSHHKHNLGSEQGADAQHKTRTTKLVDKFQSWITFERLKPLLDFGSRKGHSRNFLVFWNTQSIPSGSPGLFDLYNHFSDIWTEQCESKLLAPQILCWIIISRWKRLILIHPYIFNSPCCWYKSQCSEDHMKFGWIVLNPHFLSCPLAINRGNEQFLWRVIAR